MLTTAAVVIVAETLMRLPWDNWDSYEVGLVEHPVITKTAINMGIYIIGDWLSQVFWSLVVFSPP